MNPYLQGNQPYQNPYLSSPYQNKLDIVHVNGENGARAFQMPANSNTLLLDDTAPIVWLAQTDGAGYKTVTINVGIVATVRQGCCCDSADNLTLVLIEGAGTVENVSLRVVKE